MKVKKIKIEQYRHLFDIDLDFTYPEGHAKAGQVLDKVCLIGQSASGKTTVLNLIKNNIEGLQQAEVLEGRYLWRQMHANIKGLFEVDYDGRSLVIDNEKIKFGSKEFLPLPDIGGGSISKLLPKGLKLAYLTADIISKENLEIFNTPPTSIQLTSTEAGGKSNKGSISNDNYLYEFSHNVARETWISLSYNILDYRRRFTQLASKLINKGAIGDAAKLSREYAEWSRKNENPLIPFSEILNPILDKLNLEVDLVNTEYVVPIKSKYSEEVIPIYDLSTGTKGLLLSLFSLSELDTTASVILLDEPERSLFPDLQIELISTYQNIAPYAQLIVATHSPFIAAAFEPEERFIFYFDKEGKVLVKRGESPIGDDPNDILKNDFNVNYYNKFGIQAYQRYVQLKTQAGAETDPDKREAIVKEMITLGEKYNFDETGVKVP